MNEYRDTEAMNELRELSPLLAEFPKQLPYSLPEHGWLIRNEATLQNLAQNPTRQSEETHLTKENPFLVPDQYFSRFSEQVMSKIQREEAQKEIANLSPLLSTVSRNALYEVPEGAHAGFRETLLKELNQKNSTPVISLIFRKKILQIAIAASVVLFLLIFGWKNQFALKQNQEQVTQILSDKDFQNLLAELDEQTIIQYLQNHEAGFLQESPEYILDVSQLPETKEYLDPEFSDQFFNELEINTNLSNHLN